VHAQDLARQWSHLGLARLPLELINCPDRRLTRAALQLAAETSRDGQTEVSMLLPRRSYHGIWGRILHDQTADRITEAVSQLPHVNDTIVPFHLTGSALSSVSAPLPVGGGANVQATTTGRIRTVSHPAATPIADVRPRSRTVVAGMVHSVRVQPHGSTA